MEHSPTHSKLHTVLWVCLGGYLASTLFSISIAQITAFLGFLGLLVLHWREGSLRSLRWPLLPQFLLFIGAGILATAFAEDIAGSLRYSKKFLEPLIFFWILNSLSQINNNKNGVMQKIKVPLLCKGQSLNVGVLFVLVFGGAALLEAVVGLAQWLKFSWPDWGWSYRPYGSMENPISFAIVLMIAGLFSFAHLVFNRISVNWILFLLLFGLGLLVSFTREAWIGFFVGALFLAAIHGWRWLAGSFGIFILLYWLLPDILQSRIATMITLEGSSISERFHLWRAALYIWIDHPWVGCGFSCIESIHEAFPDHAVLKSEHFIHNSYLQILVDTGLIGLTAWMAIWVKFFAQAFRSFKNPQYFLCPDWVRFGGCAAILAFLVASLFKTHFYDQEMVMVIYAVMAFTLAPSAAMPLPSGPRSIPVSAKSPRSAKGGQIDVKSGEILPDKPS